MSITVKTLDEKKCKKAVDECGKQDIKDYVRALENALRISRHTIAAAMKKIRDLSSELPDDKKEEG